MGEYKYLKLLKQPILNKFKQTTGECSIIIIIVIIKDTFLSHIKYKPLIDRQILNNFTWAYVIFVYIIIIFIY